MLPLSDTGTVTDETSPVLMRGVVSSICSTLNRSRSLVDRNDRLSQPLSVSVLRNQYDSHLDARDPNTIEGRIACAKAQVQRQRSLFRKVIRSMRTSDNSAVVGWENLSTESST